MQALLALSHALSTLTSLAVQSCCSHAAPSKTSGAAGVIRVSGVPAALGVRQEIPPAKAKTLSSALIVNNVHPWASFVLEVFRISQFWGYLLSQDFA